MWGGKKKIEDVRVGEEVNIGGIKGRVIRSGFVKRARVLRIDLSDGSYIECTREHKIFTTRGVVHAGEIRYGDNVYTINYPLCKLKQFEGVGIRKGFARHNLERRAKKRQKYAVVVGLSMGSMSNVYDLTIDHHHCYVANGILVSNSDSFRYLSLVAGEEKTVDRLGYRTETVVLK